MESGTFDRSTVVTAIATLTTITAIATLTSIPFSNRVNLGTSLLDVFFEKIVLLHVVSLFPSIILPRHCQTWWDSRSRLCVEQCPRAILVYPLLSCLEFFWIAISFPFDRLDYPVPWHRPNSLDKLPMVLPMSVPVLLMMLMMMLLLMWIVELIILVHHRVVPMESLLLSVPQHDYRKVLDS